ncbi:hypothetical protein B9Z55_011420 [Caenorhabditis nigoni]|nr:hypothetical protein B9Z55_011420 [Caenorhabditis nigoni]
MSEIASVVHLSFSLRQELEYGRSMKKHLMNRNFFSWSVTVVPVENGEYFDLYLNAKCTMSDAPDYLKNQVEGEFLFKNTSLDLCVSGKFEGESTRLCCKTARKSLEDQNLSLKLTFGTTMGRAVPFIREQPITLSVGGRKFEVLESTIMQKFSRLRLDLLLSKETLENKNEGTPRLFYDRDPKHFQLILNFIRDGSENLPKTWEELGEFLEEAKYYELKELIKLCEEALERKSHEVPFGLVSLNVGGTVFQTTKATLTRFDGMFKTMLDNGISVKINEIDTLFIDRSPKHFDLILNFMRDGDVEFPETSREIREIRREAQYYLLGGLVEACEQFLVAGEKLDF